PHAQSFGGEGLRSGSFGGYRSRFSASVPPRSAFHPQDPASRTGPGRGRFEHPARGERGRVHGRVHNGELRRDVSSGGGHRLGGARRRVSGQLSSRVASQEP